MPQYLMARDLVFIFSSGQITADTSKGDLTIVLNYKVILGQLNPVHPNR
jgi:hypothetical protein